MKKIMLCCSAGMSTSLLVKKMIAEAEQRGLPVEINAFGVAEFDQQVGHYQVVLLGPQVKYMQKDLQKQDDAFIILDESQNTTIEQMKMFLTRIGFNSKAVITGDVTQIDLPRSTKSGLRHAIEVLAEVDEISFNFFHSEDVVRHPVVARIVNAYEAWEEADQKRKAELAAERKREAQEQEHK